MKASEAKRIATAIPAGCEEDFKRQMEEAYDMIANLAQGGGRYCRLGSVIKEYIYDKYEKDVVPNRCYEALRERLLEDGYRIEKEQRVIDGALQKPKEYIRW